MFILCKCSVLGKITSRQNSFENTPYKTNPNITDVNLKVNTEDQYKINNNS